jgi:hypothetical protein
MYSWIVIRVTVLIEAQLRIGTSPLRIVRDDLTDAPIEGLPYGEFSVRFLHRLPPQPARLRGAA